MNLKFNDLPIKVKRFVNKASNNLHDYHFLWKSSLIAIVIFRTNILEPVPT